MTTSTQSPVGSTRLERGFYIVMVVGWLLGAVALGPSTFATAPLAALVAWGVSGVVLLGIPFWFRRAAARSG